MEPDPWYSLCAKLDEEVLEVELEVVLEAKLILPAIKFNNEVFPEKKKNRKKE